MSKLDAIYQAIYNRADEVFPEFQFRRKPNGWESLNAYHPDGYTGQGKGKVYIKEHAPHYIGDNTGRGCSVWAYVSRREGVEDSREIFRKLCELAGMPYTGGGTPPQPCMHDDANNFFVAQLMTDNPGAEAEGVRDYLRGRGMADEIFKRGGNDEIGFYPGAEPTRKHLINKGFPEEEVSTFLSSLPKLAGLPGYCLTIALRGVSGRVELFSFRRTIPGDGTKYLNSTGQKASIYGVNKYALRDGAPLVLVEGVLDSLTARWAGFRNVATVGGSSLSRAQADSIRKLGAVDVVICMDADDAGRNATRQLLPGFLAKDTGKVLVADLSHTGAKDVDELLRQPGGKDSFNRVLDTAKDAGRWLADDVVARAASVLTETGKDGDVFRAEVLRMIAESYCLFPTARATEAGRVIDYAITGFGGDIAPPLTREEVMLYVTDTNRTADERRNKAKLEELRGKVGELLEGGGKDVLRALDAVEKEVRTTTAEVRSGRSLKFWQLPYSAAMFREEVAAEGDGVDTGFRIGGTKVVLPPGLSFVAANTGHGKTWLLINLILSAAERYPDNTFHFFTYEMGRAAIGRRFASAFTGVEIGANNDTALRQWIKGGERPGEVPGDFFGRWQAFTRLLDSGRLRIYDERLDAVTLSDVVRDISASTAPAMIAIDYIQLLSMPLELRGATRAGEVKDICLTLQGAAIDCRIPILLAAQFNREAASGPGALTLKNLSEGSEIEKIAELVLAAWNGDKPARVTDKPGAEAEAEGEGKIIPGTLWVTALKVRAGNHYAGHLAFNGRTGKVSNQSQAPKFT